MKKVSSILVLAVIPMFLTAQVYPFRDTRLTEEERIKNLTRCQTQLVPIHRDAFLPTHSNFLFLCHVG